MFQKVLLDNGIPLIFERVKGYRSVVLGIWVKVGSRYEPVEINGISHFIEHMLFKGTGMRSTEDIAKETDSMGADLNAFTSRENTTFYIKVLDEFIEKGIALLSDIFVNSIFDPSEIEKEKNIVEEEIRLSEDTPDDHVFDLFNAGIWGGSGLGYTILGTFESVNRITRDYIIEYIRKYYNVHNIIISLVGDIELDEVVRMLNSKFEVISTADKKATNDGPYFKAFVNAYPKDLSEVHICMGFEGIPSNSPDRYAMLVINTLLGSGVSSRLFQEVREKRGLVYSIHSFLSSYHDSGCFGVYAGASEQNYREVVELVMEQACSVRETVTPEEIQRAKNQLKGNILLALESTSARMNNLAKQEIYYGRNFTPEEVIQAIESVSLDDVKALSGKVFNRRKMAITLLGPVDKDFVL